MAENRQLTNAKSAKNDEFYTQYANIQKEVNAYLKGLICPHVDTISEKSNDAFALIHK